MGYLTILPSFPVRRAAGGGIVLTRKFISGVTAYQKNWTDGPVRVLLEEMGGVDDPTVNLDDVVVKPADLPWDLELVDYERGPLRPWLIESDMVLLAVHYRQIPIGAWRRALGVPVVYTAENALRTRLQMLQLEKLNPMIRARRALWLWQEERRVRRAIRLAAGVQCNGTPTYNVYRPIVRNSFLYFDSRVSQEMLASEQAVKQRLGHMRRTGVLRLAFSGRLVPIKGADHLVTVAEELRRSNTRFELAICGAGPSEAAMRRQVASLGLQEVVTFKGTLDFQRELLPFVRDNVDLFICCHRQGDPSCTYLETMSCGVPIAGYDNEAFRGIVERKLAAGWLSPLNRPRLLSQTIAALARTPDELAAHSLRALAFAHQHTFERTFAGRTDHLRRLASERASLHGVQA